MKLQLFLEKLTAGTLSTNDVFIYDENISAYVGDIVHALAHCRGLTNFKLDISNKDLTDEHVLAIVHALDNPKFNHITLILAQNYLLTAKGFKGLALALCQFKTNNHIKIVSDNHLGTQSKFNRLPQPSKSDDLIKALNGITLPRNKQLHFSQDRDYQWFKGTHPQHYLAPCTLFRPPPHHIGDKQSQSILRAILHELETCQKRRAFELDLGNLHLNDNEVLSLVNALDKPKFYFVRLVLTSNYPVSVEGLNQLAKRLGTFNRNATVEIMLYLDKSTKSRFKKNGTLFYTPPGKKIIFKQDEDYKSFNETHPHCLAPACFFRPLQSSAVAINSKALSIEGISKKRLLRALYLNAYPRGQAYFAGDDDGAREIFFFEWQKDWKCAAITC